MLFKDKLKRLRLEANLSQDSLASILHISRSSIAKYEAGNGYPSKEVLEDIASYFNVDITYLRDDLVSRRNKIGFRLLLIGGILLIVTVVAFLIVYDHLRVSSRAGLSYIYLFYIIFLSLLPISMIIVGFILSMIKNENKVVPLIVFFMSIILSIGIVTTGATITHHRYNIYREFTTEKWKASINDKDYRGVMVESFLEKYDITGFSGTKVFELLDRPDMIENIKLQTNPSQSVGHLWSYFCGYSHNYMDVTVFEIYFNLNDRVSTFRVATH